MSEVCSSAGQPGALSCSEGQQAPVLVMIRGRKSAADPHLRRFFFEDPMGHEVSAPPESVQALPWFARLSAADQHAVRRNLEHWARVDCDAAAAGRSAQ